MANARAGRNAGKTRVSHKRDMFAEWKVLECGGQLIGFFHTGPHGATADQHNDVTGIDRSLFDCCHGLAFAHKNARGTFLAINSVGINNARINRRALHNRTFGRQIATWKSYGTCQATCVRAIR